MASLVAQLVKNLPVIQFQSLGCEDLLEKGKVPTPAFWPGEFHGLYNPWGHRESEMTEWLSLHFTLMRRGPIDWERGQRRRGTQESQEGLVQTGTGLRQREQGFFCSKSQEGRTERTWPGAVLSGEVSGLLHPGSRLQHLGPLLQLDLPTWLLSLPIPPSLLWGLNWWVLSWGGVAGDPPLGVSSTGSPSVWGAGTTDSSEIADRRPEEDFRDDSQVISEPGLAWQDSGTLPFDPSSSAHVYLPSFCFLVRFSLKKAFLWFFFLNHSCLIFQIRPLSYLSCSQFSV